MGDAAVFGNVRPRNTCARATVIAEKMRTSLSDAYVLAVCQAGKADAMVEDRCSASIGVALFSGDAAGPEDVLKSADAAMYEAKEEGSNLIRFHAVTS